MGNVAASMALSHVYVVVLHRRSSLDLTLQILYGAPNHLQAVKLMIHGDAVVMSRLVISLRFDISAVWWEEIVPKMIICMTEVLVLGVLTEHCASRSLRSIGCSAVTGGMLQNRNDWSVIPKESR